MNSRTLEQSLARHCAPTLLGAKAGSLVSLSRREHPNLREQTEEYHRRLWGRGVAFTILREYPERSLLFVCRPALLEKQLDSPEARLLLLRFGYDPGAPVEAMLECLRERFLQSGEFPHEIGLFLGYPPEDVRAFLETGGGACKLCGYWKVYHDVEGARARFACFDACRRCLCRLLEEGGSITQLLETA